ncbi:MAG: hypothetical protein IVW55_03980 [Chloroflexi bacterium]|nr:hypothetical protein [Chloroflexota bacterium]
MIEDPKTGLARFGPRSYNPLKRHPESVKVGFIGTAYTIEKAHSWLTMNAQGVAGNEKHLDFPGYQPDRGFFSRLEFDENWNEQITQTELSGLLHIELPRERFEQLIGMLETKLRLLAERDNPPQYVLFGVPNEIVDCCGGVDYVDAEFGSIHRDLRRAFKAMAMKYRIPTQMLRQPTMEGKDRDNPAKIAWNFFTGLYFKAGGVPWGPVGLASGTCFVGIGFYRPLSSTVPTMQTSLVQAFDEHGEGLVLRGHDFEWDTERERSRSPHLSGKQAYELISLVLSRYQQEMKQVPKRVVVHKTSRYWPEERDGFRAAIEDRVAQYDLVALEYQSAVRLITTSKYPPLRGTRFSVGDLDFLYTTGFISSLNQFHAMHVPSPIRISDHVGQDTPRDRLLREILLLTKMNWNSAAFGASFPITLKFSEKVAEVLKEVPSDRDPLPQFKFYI